MKKPAGSIFPHPDTPKTCPILDANPCRRTFRSVCFCALHGYMKNLAGFIPKPLARIVWGRMQYAPTRVREKFGGFHISAPEYVKNAPDFTHPNRDMPKTCPILDPNLRRRTFRGVCFCTPTRVHQKPDGFHISTHVPTKNAPGFIFPNRDTPKTHPISPSQIRIHPKPARF